MNSKEIVTEISKYHKMWVIIDLSKTTKKAASQSKKKDLSRVVFFRRVNIVIIENDKELERLSATLQQAVNAISHHAL